MRLNLHLAGNFTFDAANDDHQTAWVQVEQTGYASANNLGYIEITRRDGLTTAIMRQGLLANVPVVEEADPSGGFARVIRIDANITTLPFVVPMNEPLEIGFAIATGGQQWSTLGLGSVTADFGHTLSFPKDRPVFDLPAGYTANSAAFGIVDNQYVVPEPATAALLGLAVIGGLAGRARSRWRQTMHSHCEMVRSLVVATLSLLVAAGAGPWLALPATAAPVYRAFVNIDNVSCFCNDQEFTVMDDRPVEAEATGGFNVRQGVARAKAGPGFLEAFGDARNQGNPNPFGSPIVHTRFYASASENADDLFFSSPPGSTVEEIPIRLNLHLAGVFGFNAAPDDAQTAAVSVEFTLPGSLTDGSGTNVVRGEIDIHRQDGVTTSIDREGLLADIQAVEETDQSGDFQRVIRINANITTPQFVIPMNVPTNLGISIRTSGQQSSSLGFGRLSLDFGHTLSFPKDRPVFDLPAGYAVNSAAFGIVDNQYVVPGPATAALLGLAVIGGLAGRARFRWRRVIQTRSRLSTRRIL